MKDQHLSFNCPLPMLKQNGLLLLIIMFLCLHWQTTAQSVPDSVIRQYNEVGTIKEKTSALSDYIFRLHSDPRFFDKAASLINYLDSVGDQRSQDMVQLTINFQLSLKGDYVKSLASSMEILNRFEQQKDTFGIFTANTQLMIDYFYAGDHDKGIMYGKKALETAKNRNDVSSLARITNALSTSYSVQNIPDSALLYARLALGYAKQSGNVRLPLGTLSEAYISAKQYDSALVYAKESLNNEESMLGMAWIMNDLSQIYLETNQLDSSKYYAQKAIGISKANEFKDQLQRAYEYLSRSFYKTRQPDSAFKYLQLAIAVKDSLYSNDKTKQIQEIMARELSRLQEMEKEKLEFKNKIRIYGLFSGLVILGIITFFLLRNNRQKQKANVTLKEQKEEIQSTLEKLESTQSQLIQSEKMASLGELTAGIAHEIQNPLNFVNNFSEVNKEMLEELKGERKKQKVDRDENLQNDLIADIFSNEEKIIHHGKRAEAIVKGMLQHSRSSTGEKELTKINVLADEYLRLAYHGLRAKDKSFNATLETDCDESIGKVNISRQDIGRVLLNLINNAFYAVAEKKKASKPDIAYEPIVTVSTKLISPTAGGEGEEKIRISVKDNGNGIPPTVLGKIFQPFYTTKPTGQGTGLGLSLSYDIVKAHGGELKVETKEGEGSEFIIQLPI